MNTISNRASSIGSIVQSLAMFLGALLYLAHLSRSVFLVIGPLLMLLLYSYVRVGHGGDKLIQRYIDARLRFLDLLTGLLKGVKELKLSRKRQREVLADYDKASNTERHVAVEINRFFEDTYLFLNVSLYSLLAALIFCVPLYMHIKDALLAQLVVVILFLWGSIQEGLSAYPGYVRAGQALESISTLRKRLVAASAGVQSVLKNINRSQPPRIEARDLEYEYPTADNNKSFRVGPFSLSIEPGELLFIVGGNGSGKSTILKVLIGLYRPSRGQLLVDGHQVWNAHVAAYREQISSIFTDFHLFARLYGVLGADPVVVTALLKKLGIDHKTAFVKGRFTERRLSTGQRKRLAMVVTLLEDRPIVVLDEWAADQDPGFRQWFYEVLLPEQKRRGKTVIAISHDDRYFHCADRVVTLDYGTVRSIVDNRGARPVE
jgi:putative ATP-binding cassette transporter